MFLFLSLYFCVCVVILMAYKWVWVCFFSHDVQYTSSILTGSLVSWKKTGIQETKTLLVVFDVASAAIAASVKDVQFNLVGCSWCVAGAYQCFYECSLLHRVDILDDFICDSNNYDIPTVATTALSLTHKTHSLPYIFAVFCIFGLIFLLFVNSGMRMSLTVSIRQIHI